MDKQWAAVERTFWRFHGQMSMGEILLCATAFSLTITLGNFPVFDSQNPIEINHKAFRLMECEPLIDMRGYEVKAAAECTFGGYYPLEQSTTL